VVSGEKFGHQHIIHLPGRSITKARGRHTVGKQSIAVNIDPTPAHGNWSENDERVPFSDGVPGILLLVIDVEAVHDGRLGDAHAAPDACLLVAG
jgi:hypothetical protein